MVIDPHAHIAPLSFIEDVRRGRFGRSISIEQGKKWELLVSRTTILGQERVVPNPLPRESFDMALRLKDMKRTGVDMQILSVVPPMTYYALDAGLNTELSAALNDAMLQVCEEHPGRFRCMAQVPLQAPKAAAAELRRAVRCGHVGVQIGSNVAGTNLDDRALDPFWRAVSDTDVPVFIHPVDVMGVNDRLKSYYLRNFIGNPLDTTIAAASLIFGGVLDRFPKMRILLAHTGGFTPWIMGRWRHGYGERQEPKVNDAVSPERYLKRFHFDTLIHDAQALQFAVDKLGKDRVVYGTDYPFDMGWPGKARAVRGLADMDEAVQKRILGDTTRRLYRLKLGGK